MRVPSPGRPRPLRVLLLALMLSPLTHPFSTVELRDVLGDPTPHDTAQAQAKPASDKLPISVAEPPASWNLDAGARVAIEPRVPRMSPGAPREAPLRI